MMYENRTFHTKCHYENRSFIAFHVSGVKHVSYYKRIKINTLFLGLGEGMIFAQAHA
jgi:hypothetical protein